MDLVVVPHVALLAGGGLAAGIGLLVRGLSSYRSGLRIADTAPSRIETMAAGEVRVSGVVEPAEVTLVSPLQSAPCVYYRSSIRESAGDDGGGEVTVLAEERAVGFRVRETDGERSIRVFPRGARFDVPEQYRDRTGAFGDEPPGLQLRTASAFAAPLVDHEAQVAALLTVRHPLADPFGPRFRAARSSRRAYREARLEPGQVVTVIGRALPFDQLDDPDASDMAAQDGVAEDDPEVAASVAAARRAGTLTNPAAAWGNAAIPGFGIGRPAEAPRLDPAARPVAVAGAEAAALAKRTFEIAAEELVIAAGPDAPLLIAVGTAAQATARNESRFLGGLLGALLAIGSALALAFMFTGGFGT
ncbi:MAG TPA: hypothetical protein VH723_05580 [Candidatus Limnocylindrales bacterium]